MLQRFKKLVRRLIGLERLNREVQAIREEILFTLKRSILEQRAMIFDRLDPRRDVVVRTINTHEAPSLEECFGRLEATAPHAYPIWKRLLDVNAETYEGYPVDSCSVKGHLMAQAFRHFVRPYLSGPVLDIGCGPQPIPLYLEDHPPEAIAGIDPISEAGDHPFAFVRGVAEFLPWSDGDFDVVVASTSLDHVLLLDVVYAEVARVLKPGGHFIVWVFFVPGAASYDPYKAGIRNVDAYHLFHFDRDWFYQSVSERFTVVEQFDFSPASGSCFVALTPKPTS